MKEYWEGLATRFGAARATGLGASVEYLDDLRTVMEKTGFDLQGSVLDIGCGTGRLADLADGDYLGVDISAPMIEYALSRGRNAKLITGPPDIDGEWDRICALSVFTHTPKKVRLEYLQVIAGALKGEALVDVFVGPEGGSFDRYFTPDLGADAEAVGLQVLSEFAQNYDGSGEHHYYRLGLKS
jgi:SAM-dependent methyltransferase